MSGHNHNQAERLAMRIEALLRLLVNEGHVSPQGAREIRKTIRGEVSR